jgi:hypothetical protein
LSGSRDYWKVLINNYIMHGTLLWKNPCSRLSLQNLISTLAKVKIKGMFVDQST